MLNFSFNIPTKVYFGQGQISVLSDAIKEYGTKVLIVSYGKASPKELAIVDAALTQMKENGITCYQLRNVEPNPRIASVREGVAVCREKGIDLVLAIGGGSVIDCAKAIAASTYYDGDPWELMIHYDRMGKVLPLGCISTMAASGTELDASAVLSDPDTNQKVAIFGNGIYPRFSILDPTYTVSIPKYQTAAGGCDILSHVMEVYFSADDPMCLSNTIAEAMMKSCIHFTRRAYNTPDDLEARANLMWLAGWAINGFISAGKAMDWTIHPIEHEVSAYYNVTHGAGMAALTPYWMEYLLDDSTVDRFYRFAVNVMGVMPGEDKMAVAKAGIQALRDFYAEVNMPKNLREMGAKDDKLEEMAHAAIVHTAFGDTLHGPKDLDWRDLYEILKAAY